MKTNLRLLFRFLAAQLQFRRLCCVSFFVFVLPVVCHGDVIDKFDWALGSSNGDFGWDDFGTTGSPYEGPHAPDQYSIGTGNGSISVSPGGLITGTNNLYSFFSVPNWNLQLSGLDSSESFTSLAVQIATSANLDASNFGILGSTPDEFVDLGQRATIGGFPYNFYWAEWQGLSASSTFNIEILGTDQHQSFAGASVVYFNTSSTFDITRVPEPAGFGMLIAVSVIASVRRRRR